MTTSNEIQALIGAQVYDHAGQIVGRIGEVYLDGATNQPAWIRVSDPDHGAAYLAPLHGAAVGDDGVRLAYGREQVTDAPAVGNASSEPIASGDVQRLHHHYRLDWSGPAGDGPGAMTRSEEQLRIASTTEVVGRVRLHRYIETEYIQMTVPVRREKVRVEHLPPADDDTVTGGQYGTSMSGASGIDGEGRAQSHEIVLHEERVVINKEIVPVERVRLTTRMVTDTETVEARLRKERIDVEVPGDEPRQLG